MNIEDKGDESEERSKGKGRENESLRGKPARFTPESLAKAGHKFGYIMQRQASQYRSTVGCILRQVRHSGIRHGGPVLYHQRILTFRFTRSPILVRYCNVPVSPLTVQFNPGQGQGGGRISCRAFSRLSSRA